PAARRATVEHIAEFVSTLLRESDANVTLFNIPESEDEASTGEFCSVASVTGWSTRD
ncbi:MAG: hypothetical protein J07HR59_00705, partial [Halorubrum sp. J07HR59]